MRYLKYIPLKCENSLQTLWIGFGFAVSIASSSGYLDHLRYRQLRQFNIRISQKKPPKNPNWNDVSWLHTAGCFWCLWGIFSSASGKMPMSSQPQELPQCKEAGIFGGSVSVTSCLAGGTSHASDQVRVQGCATTKGCCFRLSAGAGKQRIGCYEAACWACYGVFSQIGLTHRKRVFFPRYLLSVPPWYLVLA